MKNRKSASEFPQEVWQSFDRYVHGDIDRRTFLEKLQTFAIGGLTVTALYEALKPEFAWAIQVEKTDKRIMTETVTIDSPTGNGKVTGHFARPSAATSKKRPVVLVVHENRGLNPYIEDDTQS